MTNCDKCGFPLPEGAGYCPSCGASVLRRAEVFASSFRSVGRILQAGVLGAFISMMIQYFSPPGIDLYFIPSFLASLIVVYLSKAHKLEQTITIALCVYIFADAMVGGLVLGTLYAQGISLAMYYSVTFGNNPPSAIYVIIYVVNPVTALIAGYIGSMLTSKSTGKEISQTPVKREEERGGIIFSLKRRL